MMAKRFNNPNVRYPVNARSHKVTLTSGSQDKGLSYRQTPVGRLCTDGLKSEVQHLASGKVHRCKPVRHTDSFSLRSA
jgi:hypothetical protein